MDIKVFQAPLYLEGAIVIKDVSEIKEGDRLFIEIGHNEVLEKWRDHKTGEMCYNQKWVSDEYYKEIKDPWVYIHKDDRMKDPEFIKHHGMVIIKNTK